MRLPLDNNGWSVLPTYTNNIYVSSSSGSDSNTGSQSAPLKTLNAAYKKMQANTAMWLKRGDTFTDYFPGGWVWPNTAIAAYGTIAANNRPQLVIPSGQTFLFSGNGRPSKKIPMEHRKLTLGETSTSTQLFDLLSKISGIKVEQVGS
jgi:hypothetical protein